MSSDPNMQREQEEWIEDEPRARGRIPGWAKFCGCGCLLVFALVVTLVVVIGGEFRRGVDAELQWEELAEVLPYDARPESMKPLFGWRRITPFFLLNDTRGYMWVVRAQEQDGERFREAIFGGDPNSPEPILKFRHVGDEESSSVEIQGRELTVKRFFQSGAPILEALADRQEDADGQSVLIDVTPEGSKGLVVVFLVEGEGEEPISDDELRELLAPFHIGPDHVPYVAPVGEPDVPAGEDR